MDILYIILAVILVVIFIILSYYNKLIKLLNKVKQAESTIDVFLNKRFELIPNLVETVKGYSNYESSTLEDIVELRNSYNKKPGVNFRKATEINEELNSILAIAEAYPELKANEQYLNLQSNLSKIESELQAARRVYNDEVTKYNTKIESVPANIVAAMFNFKTKELFQINEDKKENIKIGEI